MAVGLEPSLAEGLGVPWPSCCRVKVDQNPCIPLGLSRGGTKQAQEQLWGRYSLVGKLFHVQCHRASLVALLVVLGDVHVALGVAGVVGHPHGDRGTCYSDLSNTEVAPHSLHYHRLNSTSAPRFPAEAGKKQALGCSVTQIRIPSQQSHTQPRFLLLLFLLWSQWGKFLHISTKGLSFARRTCE